MQVTSYFLQKWENQAFNKLFFILYKKTTPVDGEKLLNTRGNSESILSLPCFEILRNSLYVQNMAEAKLFPNFASIWGVSDKDRS